MSHSTSPVCRHWRNNPELLLLGHALHFALRGLPGLESEKQRVNLGLILGLEAEEAALRRIDSALQGGFKFFRKSMANLSLGQNKHGRI